MDFALTEEHEAVQDLAAQILADATTPERLSAVEDGFDRRAWAALAEAGLLGVALPEAVGGSGLGFLGAHLVLEQVGATAAAVPFWETVVLGALPLAVFGSAGQQEVLADVLAGNLLLTAALAEDGATDPAAPRTQAITRDGGGWELIGAKTNVPAGAVAGLLLVSAATADGTTGVWLVPADAHGVEVRAQEVIDETAYAEIVLDGVKVGPDALLGEPGADVLDWLLLHGAAGLASLTAGICTAVVRLSADYTSRREQFGRPVATFQAVAQRMADAFIDAEGATLTALQAAWRLTEGLPAGDEVAIAKWWAAEASHRVIHAAHHVHGGVGVDREYPLHRYFGKAKQAEFQFGGATTHLLRLGASLAAEPA